MIKRFYTVWVGGVEVADDLLTIDEANKVAQSYIDDGYDDVEITEYD